MSKITAAPSSYGGSSSRLESFSKRYLNDQPNSKEFLKSVSYTVELGGNDQGKLQLSLDLMKVKKSCAYHENMEYCPVLIEIIPQRIQDYYRGSYLLQVYSKTDMIYEKVLKYEIVSWNIFHDYFVFKLDRREEGSQWINIVHLSDGCKVMKVKDFAPDQSYIHLGVNQKLFFYGNSDVIKIVDIKKEFGNEKSLEISPTPEQILTYEIGSPCKLHGFFENGYSRNDTYIMCAIECDDNQLDFTRLYVWERDNLFSSGNLEFFQYREVVPRDLSGDKVVKFVQVVKKNEFQFGLALRASGKVDFYWNFTLTNQPDKYFNDISCNFDALFLRNDQENMTYQCRIKWDSRIGIEVADTFTTSDEHWRKIMNDNIRNYVKFYAGIALVHTTFFVCYGQIVSTFDIIKKLWVDHFIYDEEVTDILRNKTDYYGNTYAVGILLASGKIKHLEAKQVDNQEVWYQSTKEELNIFAEADTIVSDWRDMSSHYILTNKNGSKKMWGYQNEIVKEISSEVSLNNDHILLRYLSSEPTKDIALFSKNDNSIKVYCSANRTGEVQLYMSDEYKMNNTYEITGTPHTAVVTNNENYVFIFDERNIYILDIKKKDIRTLSDFNIQGLQISDGNKIYMLQNELPEKDRAPGLYSMNLENLIDDKQGGNSLILRLKNAIVGRSNLIDYYLEDERIAYMHDYEQIKIVPILHRNVINFIGMKRREDYLAFKRLNDKLIALDKSNILTTWNITTGKVKGQFTLKTPIVTENFKIYATDVSDVTYHSDWYMPKLLLYDDVTEVTDIDQDQYFGDRLKTSLKNNTAYTKIENKTFRIFKLIEILSETEVIEHYKFAHPHYGFGSYQRIYFSDDNEYMLERLINQRVFLYRRIPSNRPGEIAWQVVRRIRQFPMDLSECTYNNFLFSPNLMFYLDYDRNSNSFLIKRSLDQSVCLELRKAMELTSKNEDERKLIAQKFKWISNTRVKIINNEGIEKIIDISRYGASINQGTVPMIELDSLKTNNTHFYFHTHTYSIGDTLARLKRKYQNYFSAYYVDNKSDPSDLYSTLFDVDFGIDQFKGKPVIDLSFTYLHLKMAEILKKQGEKGVKIRRLNDEEVQTLLLNIYPTGKTILHYTYKNLNIIRKLYERVDKINENVPAAEKYKQFEIPFMQDFYGRSPLHMCLKNNNFKSANILLEKMQKTQLDSHARAIYSILPKIVESKLTNFGPYLDSRFMQSKLLEEYRRGAILYRDGLEYSVSTCDLWPDIESVEKKLLVKNPLDSEIKLEFLDMPSLHSYNDDVGYEFFKELADADIEIFEFRSIRALIDYKWPLAREYTIKMLFIPFLVYLITFSVYSNAFNNQYSDYNLKYRDEDSRRADIALSILLYLFSFYFLFNEARQLSSSGLDYLKSVWNYSDLLPPILICVVVSLHLNIQYNEIYLGTTFMTTVHSFASLLVWAKFIYFLRIFKLTGHLVRILTDVIYDMKIFLLILFIVYMAFGEAFLRISEASSEESRFIASYAYAFIYAFRLSIGDTATDTFEDVIQPTTLWIIWTLGAILTNVVMLNLLIAIISESFGRIMENKDRANYQEKARIIFENSYLIPSSQKKKLDDVGKLLIVAYEVVGEDEDDEKVQIQNKVDTISEVVDELKKTMNEQVLSKIDSLKENQASLEAKIDQLLASKK